MGMPLKYQLLGTWYTKLYKGLTPPSRALEEWTTSSVAFRGNKLVKQNYQ